MTAIKGFKAMNKDMTCRGFQFQVGEIYETGGIDMCQKGFHFCEVAFNVYDFYPKTADTIVCEVEALGQVLKEGTKSVTDKIKIIRRLSDIELLNLWINRTNSGHRNSGDYNSGDYNSGDYNSGDYNSGHYNSGHRNSGFFNSNAPTVRLFNKDSQLTFDSSEVQKIRNLPVKPILTWVYSDRMTEEEKTGNPSYVTTGGFLRNSGRVSWDALTVQDFEFIKSLSNFDVEIFQTITGINLSKTE